LIRRAGGGIDRQSYQDAEENTKGDKFDFEDFLNAMEKQST